MFFSLTSENPGMYKRSLGSPPQNRDQIWAAQDSCHTMSWLLESCCTKLVNLKCVHFMYRPRPLSILCPKCSLTWFESRLQGSTLNIEACVYVKCTSSFVPFSFEPSKLETRSSKDECSTGSNNHLRSTDLYRLLYFVLLTDYQSVCWQSVQRAPDTATILWLPKKSKRNW